MTGTFYHDDSNYFNDTDSSDDPICSGQGLYCQVKYRIMLFCIFRYFFGGSSVILMAFEFGNFIPYDLTHIALFIALFIVALMGSIKISKYKSLGENFIEVSKLQQKRLYSFILYTYSIEVITLPMFDKFSSFGHPNINSVYTCVEIICMFTGYKGNLAANKFMVVLDEVNYFFRRDLKDICELLVTFANAHKQHPNER
uniref:Uncharacterized protein n=1 Tax=Onchocerca volvulus TaxID=6282 RepID=A0A8R1TM03_ONCVO